MSTTTPEPAATITEQTFDLLEWLRTGTVARRQVAIYIDHEAYAEVSRIYARLDELGWQAEDAAADQQARPQDGPLSEADHDGDDETAALLAELEPWEERLHASRMLWTVRALSQDEVERSFDAVPVPKMPTPPKENAPQPLQDKFLEKVAAYHRAKAEADRERNLWLTSVAVVGLETPQGTTDTVPVDQLRALRAMPHGQQWLDMLYAAMNEAASEEAAPPVPTSPGRSTSTRD